MTRDVAASVRQRLLNRARAEGRPFNQMPRWQKEINLSRSDRQVAPGLESNSHEPSL